ncbi:MAG: hypothetical protein P9M00_02570 [Candidatus Tritonobacter lacicola]|nr:hypothetical protein [Candidatus Tritonobacter lacicola]
MNKARSVRRRETVPDGRAHRRRTGPVWALLVFIAAALALFSAANLPVLWVRGIGLLLPESRVEVVGLSTDVISMVAVKRLLFAGKMPAGPSLEITGSDVFIAYDPWLRRDIFVGAGSVAVEGRIQPHGDAVWQAIPLLGLFRRFRVALPEASFRVLWNGCLFSCDESSLAGECASGEDILVSCDLHCMRVSRAGDLVAILEEVKLSGRSKRKGAITLSSLLAGSVEAGVGRVELDMEALSGLGKREKFLATGKFAGSANAAMDGGRLKRVDVELFSEGGGSVTMSGDFIKGYLGRMAAGPQRESMEIVLESLRDYTFNRGVIRAELIDDRIVAHVELDGASGPRDLYVNFIDFLKGGRIVSNPLLVTGR